MELIIYAPEYTSEKVLYVTWCDSVAHLTVVIRNSAISLVYPNIYIADTRYSEEYVQNKTVCNTTDRNRAQYTSAAGFIL